MPMFCRMFSFEKRPSQLSPVGSVTIVRRPVACLACLTDNHSIHLSIGLFSMDDKGFFEAMGPHAHVGLLMMAAAALTVW